MNSSQLQMTQINRNWNGTDSIVFQNTELQIVLVDGRFPAFLHIKECMILSNAASKLKLTFADTGTSSLSEG
jgi:hypothetical protein